MTHANAGLIESFRRLNIITGLFLTVFILLGIWLSGLGQAALEALDGNPLIGMIVTLLCLVVIFASSSTRSPDRYHYAEMFVVFLGLGLMFAMQFIATFADFVASTQPVSGTIVLIVMVLAGLIIGK